MKIAILGAGSIGAYLGGALIAAGADVVLIGRARMAEKIARHGLQLSDLQGRTVALAPAQINYVQQPAALSDADLILVTVKSADTAEAAQTIATHATPTALVVSFQNGIGNADTLRAALPGRVVLAGMVPFNVVQMDNGRLHRGTEGELMLEISSAIAVWKPVFQAAGLPLLEQSDFIGVSVGQAVIEFE